MSHSSPITHFINIKDKTYVPSCPNDVALRFSAKHKTANPRHLCIQTQSSGADARDPESDVVSFGSESVVWE